MTALPDIFPHTLGDLPHDAAARFGAQLIAKGVSPFGAGDTTAGMEYELQVAVEGSQHEVDLPRTIRQSSYYRNIEKRAAHGDAPKSGLQDLQTFLDENSTGVWENSWVRFDAQLMGSFAHAVFTHDLQSDKRNPTSPLRSDAHRFHYRENGRQVVRIPVSYLLKLALADILDPAKGIPPGLHTSGVRLLHHFQSDNTSPEILSLTIPDASQSTIGCGAARETARTFLITQLLCQYANIGFGLAAGGQRCLIYNAPHAPSRQKRLNELVPDGYYRHLFMSPCLSGWDQGEEKHRYMSLCHQTLSRSQLSAIGKLRDAGILPNNLVVLPNTSNTCLANNGTHVSLGSRQLSAMAAEGSFTPAMEKYYGDLVIKIVEHFLPLLVGTCSAAPYRIDFADFHPEKVLGFLPHELDYTHLRMLWRRWKKKAHIRAGGRAFTPFGPRRLDQLLATLLRLHGDLIPDFRLTDYFISLLSTDTSPALNGMIGNQEQLKAELAELGIFDSRMSIYLLYRMRAYSHMGYSGFEGRSYSLFPSFLQDMAAAVDLQNLITCVAYQLALSGKVSHRDIPDIPVVESERRQIFFASAIGIPTVYIHNETGNIFLRRIIADARSQRASRRYKKYIRITVDEYRQALVRFLQREGAAMIEPLRVETALAELSRRLAEPGTTAWHTLVGLACKELGTRRDAAHIPADTFNQATEKCYRTTLRTAQLQEGLNVLLEDCAHLERHPEPLFGEVMRRIAPTLSARRYLENHSHEVISEDASATTLRNITLIALAAIHHKNRSDKPSGSASPRSGKPQN